MPSSILERLAQQPAEQTREAPKTEMAGLLERLVRRRWARELAPRSPLFGIRREKQPPIQFTAGAFA
jgi:hypothetical protein